MDIDGQDAFDRVLDKALDLAAENNRQRITINEKDADIRRLKQSTEDLARRVTNETTLSSSNKVLQVALDNVWRAADLFSKEPVNQAARDNLKQTLKETENLVDPIPF